MRHIVLTGICTLVAVTLSGCGGGGSGDDIANNATVGNPSGITNADAIARFSALNTGFVAVDADTTTQTDLPTGGTADYSGTFGFDVRGALSGSGDVDASMVGDMDVTVNFAGTQTINGSATNFLYADTEGNFDRADGTLTIAGTVETLQRAGLPDLDGVIAANATGDLMIDQSDGMGDKTVSMDLDMSGQFGGVGDVSSASTPEAMRGFVIGSGAGDLTLTMPNGRFAAETAGAGILP